MIAKELLHALSANREAALLIKLPTGEYVPEHFHITEVAKVTKEFVDCGGTTRKTVTCVLQVWVAKDFDHRLSASKLTRILNMAEQFTQAEDRDLPVEVEYETNSISQYPLLGVETTYNYLVLVLGTKHTDCLAKDKCGVEGCC